jgi:hypothetical protein
VNSRTPSDTHLRTPAEVRFHQHLPVTWLYVRLKLRALVTFPLASGFLPRAEPAPRLATVARLRAVRGRGSHLLGVVIVACVSASRADTEQLVEPPSRLTAESLKSDSSPLFTTPDRPVLSGIVKLEERQRTLSAAKVGAASLEASVFAGSLPLDPPSPMSVGAFACCLAGRGPPLA